MLTGPVVQILTALHLAALCSSAEAEYRAVANGVAEATWLHQLLHDLQAPLSPCTLVYYDNIRAMYLSTNPIQHQRTKHVEINLHFIREKVTISQVRILHVSMILQFVDIFMKGLPSLVFNEFWSNLNICNDRVVTAGGVENYFTTMYKTYIGHVRACMSSCIWACANL
jgi:hypothetical protein